MRGVCLLVLTGLALYGAQGLQFTVMDAKGKETSAVTLEGGAADEDGWQPVRVARAKTKGELVEHFGPKHGAHMYEEARGIDDSPLETDREAKSIGSETTFDVDTLDASKILATFKALAAEVAASVKKEKKLFKTISIVVRFSDFDTKTRAHTIEEASDDKNVLEAEALKLLLPFLDSRENPKRKKLRLVGVRAEKLTPALASSSDLIRGSITKELF